MTLSMFQRYAIDQERDVVNGYIGGVMALFTSPFGSSPVALGALLLRVSVAFMRDSREERESSHGRDRGRANLSGQIHAGYPHPGTDIFRTSAHRSRRHRRRR